MDLDPDPMDLMDLRLTGFGSRSNPSISYTARRGCVGDNILSVATDSVIAIISNLDFGQNGCRLGNFFVLVGFLMGSIQNPP